MNVRNLDNLLAIDSSGPRLKLALSFGGDRLVKSDEDVARSHGQMIVRKIGNLISSAGLKPSELHGIIVSTGPGSFTGLRIGLAVAKGMAVATQVPVVGISLYDLAAFKYQSVAGTIGVVIQVRRDEVLVGHIVSGQFEIGSVKAVPVSELKNHLKGMTAIGVHLDITSLVPGVQTPDYEQGELEIDPADFIYLGRQRLESGHADDIAALEPLYLQKSQAEIRFEQRQQQK